MHTPPGLAGSSEDLCSGLRVRSLKLPINPTELRGRFALPADRDRDLPLDGLRGIAVLLVFIVHFHACISRFLLHDAGLNVSHRLAAFGYSGVDIFFALSGYLIYGGLTLKPAPYWKYLRRRARRIYPTFLAVFAFYIAIGVLQPALRKWPAQPLPAAVYLAQNLLLLPGAFPIPPVITVAWTLSIEALFYLTIPIVIGLLRLRAWNPICRAALWVIGIPLFTWIGRRGADGPSEMVMFTAGMMAFELSHIRALKRLHTLPGEITIISLNTAAILLILFGAHNEGAWQNQILFGNVQKDILWLALTGLVWFSLRPDGVLRTLFSLKVFRFVGLISYSLYFVHGAVLNAFRIVLIGGAQRWPVLTASLLLPVTLAFAIAAACVLFAFVEFPFSVSRRAHPRPNTKMVP